MFLPGFNFAGLPQRYTTYKRARVVILPIPYEQTTSYFGGTRFGPSAIISASRNLELYDEELDLLPYKVGIHTSKEIEPIVADPKKMLGKIKRIAVKFLKDGKFLISLGGEHSITYGLIKAYKERFNDLEVIQLDAHADLRENYQGTKFNHACVMKRVKEITPAIQMGIRSVSDEEIEVVKMKDTKIIFAKDLNPESKTFKRILLTQAKHTYVTIDLDFFDPSSMPSVGTPEPGGADWYQALEILKYLSKTKEIVGFDVVELSPMPGNIYSDFTAAKLIYKFLGYLCKNQKNFKERLENI